MKKFLVPPASETPPTDPEVPSDPVSPPTDPVQNDTIPQPVTPTDPPKNDTQPEDTKPTDPVTPPSEPANVVPNNATEQEVSEFFTTADADKDGFVTKDEVKVAFASVG